MALFNKKIHKNNGFSAIETLVGVAVLAMILTTVYQVYFSLMDAVRLGKMKVVASSLIAEQFEIVRNLPYSDVGISGGIPDGKLTGFKTVSRSGNDFGITTTIRNIDDPFDGTIGGTPNDTSPADYKLVEVEVDCISCKNFTPVSLTTIVAPKNLEMSSGNGALFVRVFDSNGVPVQGANVQIENNQETPAIVINDVTNNAGMLQIVDTPPGVEAYEITVTKDGYSTEKTYPSGAPENPNPNKPHATVLQEDVTQVSFAIDKTSTLNISSVTETCAPVSNVDFQIAGSKTIGTNPDILKYYQSLSTDSSGISVLSGLEWDTYSASSSDSVYDFSGSIPLLPINLSAGSSQDLKFVVSTKSNNNFLVTVKDASTQLPLENATVSLKRAGSATTTLVTSQGFLRQTDWSLGSGQVNFINEKMYFNSDGNIKINNPEGSILLESDAFGYVSSGELESSSFAMGPGSNFDKIIWTPQSQPTETGPNSVKFQIASNNDNATWEFLGPNGATSTYYTLSDTNINPIHNGDKYFRYKVFLETADNNFTPRIDEVSFTFSSACIPPGQVFFKNLPSDTYELTVSAPGYQTFLDSNVDISSPWSQYEVSLSP